VLEIIGIIPDIMNIYRDQFPFQSPFDDTVGKSTRKHRGKKRQYIKEHIQLNQKN
jgi:hypothetical protein